MRFKFDVKEPNKKIRNKLYYKWADSLYENGFTYRLDELMTDLCVSINWVHSILYPEVDSVRYTQKYMFEKLQKNYDEAGEPIPEGYSTICFNKDQIIDFIKSNSTYTRQTRLVELCDWLDISNDVLEKYMQEYQNIYKSLPKCFYYNLPTETFNKWLKETYNVHIDMLQYKNRNIYAHEPVEPLNIFDPNYILIVANEHERNNQETLYREMICNGAIKVSLGTKKTFFMIEKNNYKHPYVVPYLLITD